ncbi:hypothetical protein, partial [Pseudomonas syringae]|uniref:hypothetical protein n=1 Tax=Pseudomonas syringae TaxID=317 RepID=UPI001F2520EA
MFSQKAKKQPRLLICWFCSVAVQLPLKARQGAISVRELSKKRLAATLGQRTALEFNDALAV